MTSVGALGGGAFNTADWTMVGAASIASGVLSVPLLNSYANGAYTKVPYSLTGSELVVRVGGTLVTADKSRELCFGLVDSVADITSDFSGATNGLYWYGDGFGSETGGEIQAAYKASGTAHTVGSEATWSSGATLWLRIREASGTVYWETSTDGSTWTTLYSAADATVDPNAVMGSEYVAVNGGFYTSGDTGVTMTLDNLNEGVTPPPAAAVGSFMPLLLRHSAGAVAGGGGVGTYGGYSADSPPPASWRPYSSGGGSGGGGTYDGFSATSPPPASWTPYGPAAEDDTYEGFSAESPPPASWRPYATA